MLVADYIVEYLKRSEGVTHVFTFAGGTNAPLLNSIHHSDGIDYVSTRHESNAAMAACGYALAADRLGVAISIGGPGASNMVTGVVNAWCDSIPVLFLTGQVTTSTLKLDNPARQIGYQELDIIPIVKTITKDAEMMLDPLLIPASLTRMAAAARSGRPGPVLMDLPFDVLRKDIPADAVDEQGLMAPYPPVGADPMRAFWAMVQAAHRPLIIAGGGVRSVEARALLAQFAEHTQIPVVVSLMGRDAFPSDHPLYFGFIGAYGNRYANIAMANSDLLIAVGSRLDGRQTSTPQLFARGAKKVHIEIDRHEINNNIKVDLAIHTDLRHFLREASRTMPPNATWGFPDWMEYHRRLEREFDLVTDVQGPVGQLVHPKRFLREVSRLNDRKTVYLADVGNNQMLAAQSLIVKRNQRFLTSGGLGAMGFALPASIGAAFAAPDSQIIVITGDGGFQMAIQELQSIVHLRIPVKIILLNNHVLGMIKVFQDELYAGVHAGSVRGYSTPDFGKVAAAYGISHQCVDSDEAAQRFIPVFLAEPGPFLLEVALHPDWTAYPKIRFGGGIEHQLPAIPEERLQQFMLPLPLPDR